MPSNLKKKLSLLQPNAPLHSTSSINFHDQCLNESDVNTEFFEEDEEFLETGGEDNTQDIKVSVETETDDQKFTPAKAERSAALLSDIGSTFVIGGISGITAKSVIAPFDRVKIVFQTTKRLFGFLKMYRLMRVIVIENGIFSLWRGHSLTLLRTFPYAGIQFMSFDIYKDLLKPTNEEQLSPWRRFAAGSLAGTTASMSVYPLELLRSRMAVQQVGVPNDGGAASKMIGASGGGRKGPGLLFNVHSLIHSYGLRGLYLGLKPALIGMVPYAGIAFGSFETLKIMTLQQYNQQELQHQQRVINGAVSGLVAQTLTYPLDIVRRRMQTEGAHDLTKQASQGTRHLHVSMKQRRYTGVIQTLVLVFREEGLRQGLYKGVTLNWFKGPLALGISFSTYDALKTYLKTEK